MMLKENIKAQLPAWQDRVKKLVKESGDVKVGEVTISQVYGGMRGVKSLVTDISSVDPGEGIRLRGYTISELVDLLPKLPGAEMPLVGGLYFLLLTGDIPSLAEAQEVEDEWNRRGQVPDHVIDVLKSMPSETPAMTMFSIAIMALQSESLFTGKYNEGIRKEEYWEYTLEDSLNLTAKLPTLAAMIYHVRGKRTGDYTIDPKLDWSANFARMMGVTEPDFIDLSRLYFIIHSDHESGNVSAHATHMVGSTLSDIYLAASAGLNGLAGPLHGKANQESLDWLLKVYERYGRVPARDELYQFAWDTLKSGQVIPGYGHAILRITDPRFIALYDYGNKHFPDDGLFKLACMVYDVVPKVLMEQGKAKDPWPNVDSISGSLLHHYQINDCEGSSCGFYTVMFGVSRILGVSSNMVWARALGQPLERPKSLTTAELEEIASRVTA